MADRYWVGGTGTWDTTSTAVWSATSGGASGASVPTAADNVFFDQAGTYTVSMTGAIRSLDLTVSAGTVTFVAGTGPTLAITGSLSLIAGTLWSSTSTVTFNATTSRNITAPGVVFACSWSFSAAGSWALQSAITLNSARTVTLQAGTLNLNGYTLTCGLFNSSNLNTRAIAFDTGNITVVGTGAVWTTATVTGLTTSGTQVVNVSYAGASAVTVSSGSLSESSSISFNFTAGTYALTLSAGSKRNLSFAGFAGTVSNTAQTIYGNLTIASAATYTAGGNAWTFAATSGSYTITTNGKTVDFPIGFANSIGGTWTLGGALTMGSTRTLSLFGGTFNTAGYSITAGALRTDGLSAHTVNLSTSTITLAASGTALLAGISSTTDAALTLSAASSYISLTSASAKTASLSSKTWGTINQGGAGALTLSTYSTSVTPTIGDLTNTVSPATVLFDGGDTFAFNAFSLSGTAGNLVTLGSVTAGSTFTLSKASGTVGVSYCTISDSIATGGATWSAYTTNGNVDGGNNTGWIFAAPSGNTGNMFFMF